MSQSSSDYVTPLINLFSVIIAALALIFAVTSEKRAGRRYEESIRLQERIATASVRPLLTVHGDNTTNAIKIVLKNDGLGAAIITRFLFQRNGRETESIALLLDRAKQYGFDTSYVTSGKSTLAVGKEIYLLVLTTSHLQEQGLSLPTIEEVFGLLEKEIVGVNLVLDYEDVLGNKQPSSPIDLARVVNLEPISYLGLRNQPPPDEK